MRVLPTCLDKFPITHADWQNCLHSVHFLSTWWGHSLDLFFPANHLFNPECEHIHRFDFSLSQTQSLAILLFCVVLDANMFSSLFSSMFNSLPPLPHPVNKWCWSIDPAVKRQVPSGKDKRIRGKAAQIWRQTDSFPWNSYFLLFLPGLELRWFLWLRLLRLFRFRWISIFVSRASLCHLELELLLLSLQFWGTTAEFYHNQHIRL